MAPKQSKPEITLLNFPALSPHLSGLIWTVMLSSAAIVITLPRESGIRTLVASTILRLIFSVGPEPTLWLLGFLTVSRQKKYLLGIRRSNVNVFCFQVLLKIIHLISIIGNQGTLSKSIEQIVTNVELLYHLFYLIFCFLGIAMHPFFFSVLVSSLTTTFTIRLVLRLSFGSSFFSYSTSSTEKKLS